MKLALIATSEAFKILHSALSAYVSNAGLVIMSTTLAGVTPVPTSATLVLLSLAVALTARISSTHSIETQSKQDHYAQISFATQPASLAASRRV
jgi:hypothetical protein